MPTRDDLGVRMQLLVFYPTAPAMPADRVRLLRRKHSLWIIEHHPDHDMLREFGVIAKSGVRLADPEGWSAADRLWRALLRRCAACTRSVCQRGRLLPFQRPRIRFATGRPRSHRLSHHPRIAEAKGALGAYRMLDVKNFDQYGRPTASHRKDKRQIANQQLAF
jgi:hypothetical protein